MLHYGILWTVSGTAYAFDKHWHYDFDALACPPWNLRWPGWCVGRAECWEQQGGRKEATGSTGTTALTPVLEPEVRLCQL